MHPNVHCSTVYNGQDMETTQMSIDRGIDKDDVVYTHTHAHTHTYTHNEYYSAIKKNEIRPLAATWKDSESVISNEVIHREGKILLCFSFSEINNCRYYQSSITYILLPPSNNHSPEVCLCVLFQCCVFFFFNLAHMLGAGALGLPRGMVWGGRREEGSGWGTHVYLWRIHFDIWQN